MITKRQLIAAFIVVVLIAVAFFIAGCGPGAKPEKLATGKEYDSATLWNSLAALDAGNKTPINLSSAWYAEVNSRALASFNGRFRADLSKRGIPVSNVTGNSGWDQRFNCTFFAEGYIYFAAVEFYLEQFHSDGRAAKLAIAEIWYKPDAAVNRHAVVYMLTDTGEKFIEPITGQELAMSTTERHSISLRKL